MQIQSGIAHDSPGLVGPQPFEVRDGHVVGGQLRAEVEDDLGLAGEHAARRGNLAGHGAALAHGFTAQALLAQLGFGLLQGQITHVGHGDVDRTHVHAGVVGLHAQVEQGVGEDVADHGSGHHAAGDIDAGFAAGGVEGNEADVLRIVHRRDADEGDDAVLGLIAVFVVDVQLFGGTGLAAHAVAGELGVARRAVGDDGLDQLAHLLGGVLADGLADDGFSVFFHHGPVLVQNLGDHVGLQDVAAVDYGGDGAHHLDRRGLHGLTEGHGGQLSVFHQLCLGVEDAGGLAGHIDPGLFQQPEGVDVIIEFVAAQQNADVGKGDVAGVLQGLSQRFRAVTLSFPAVQGGLTVCVVLCSAAIEAGVFVDHLFLQRGGQGNGLEGGAGLVAVGDAAVTPLLEPGCGDGVVVLLDQKLVFRRVRNMAFQLVVDLLQLFLCGQIENFQIVVGIIAALDGHGQDRPGVHVHDDAEGAVLHVVFFNGRFEVFLQIHLHRGVDGQHQGIAVGGLVVFFIGIEHLRLVVAAGGDDGARRALQHVVVVGLQPVAAAVLGVGKADDLGRRGSGGVIALRVRFKMNAAELVVGDELPDSVGLLQIPLAGDDLVSAVQLGRLFPNGFGVDVQNGGQPVGNEVHVFLGIVNFPGIDKHVLHGLGGREDVHIAIVDHAAVRGDGRGAGLIADGAALIAVVIHKHQRGQLPDQRNEQHDPAEKHDKGRPAQNAVSGLRPVVNRNRLLEQLDFGLFRQTGHPQEQL